MKGRAIIVVFVLFLTWVTLSMGSSVSACVLGDDGNGCAALRSLKPTVRAPIPLNIPAPKPVAARPQPTPVSAVPAAPRGDSPGAAISADGTTHVIPPGSSQWYRLADSPNPLALEVWLDAGGNRGIGFGVFGPDQMNPYSPDHPVGRGTYSRNSGHDLNWSGQYLVPGTWYAVVTNSTGAPVNITVGTDQQQKGPRNCIGYWEPFPNGQTVYWVDCGMYHPNLR